MKKIIVVKIGGAISTNKNSKYEIDTELMVKYAKAIRKEWLLFEERVILVLGGGSFGNVVPTEYNLVNYSKKTQREDICEMTLTMFTYMGKIARIFKNHGVACYPFQTSSVCTTDNGLLEKSFIDSVRMCLDLKIMPIMTGDLTFDRKERIHIFSSDKVPEMIAKHVDVEKVIYLTNTDGVYRNTNDKSSLVEEINSENFDVIISSASGSNQQDVTGGMYVKLQSMKKLSEYGVNSIILNGRDPKNIIRVLKGEPVLSSKFSS